MNPEIFKDIPLVIAGPMLRHVANDHIIIWFVTSGEFECDFILNDNTLNRASLTHAKWHVGERCVINTIRAGVSDHLLQDGAEYTYDVGFTFNSKYHRFSQLMPDMLYASKSAFYFVFKSNITNVIHGSCRKAHYCMPDSLSQLAGLLAPVNNANKETDQHADKKARPDLVIFTGDQVYVDDVAGPMLHAIQQCIQLLGLYDEDINGSTITNSKYLIGHPYSFYKRNLLLPEMDTNENLQKVFFKGKKKPIFTSVNADNHLIALNEMLSLYLLTWSSRLWSLIDLSPPQLDPIYETRYATEKCAIDAFCEGLPDVQKALAHVPTYMIFDDHDITDDWNLTRGWEEFVYGNPYSKRIIGNALFAYFLCQGVGNPHEHLTSLLAASQQNLAGDNIQNHDQFIDQLLAFSHWHYKLDTHPPIQVLDTRTQRWRSESNPNKPSGLMDWEGLCDLQQDVIGKESVIIVSAAPMYGVKFIEAIQRLFTAFGGALVVDAENWMAHAGTANVMLNIFTHQKTPPNFIILSGDVHYSFVYDVKIRFRKNSPKILQFTCSGIHNEFPNTLLRWFDRLNHFFYSHKSPLNFLTKRRNMSIKERDPAGFNGNLVNKCALGLLQLNEDGTEKSCKLILADGDVIEFIKP